MRIGTVYSPDLHSCRGDEPLVHVATRMVSAQVGALAVLDAAGGLAGIITERDLARAVAGGADPAVTPVYMYATSDVAVADVEDDIDEVGSRMLDAGVRHLPVVSKGRPIGMVSVRDLLAVHTWA